MDNQPKISADEINDYFIDCVETMLNNFPHSSQAADDMLIKHKTSNPNSLFLRDTDANEVISIIKDLKTKQSQDVYGMTMAPFKYVAEEIGYPLAAAINSCFEQGCFPLQLKKAKIVPIFQKGVETYPENYRPVAILPVISKVLEKLVFNRLMTFINRYAVLSCDQFGFRKNCSTTDAILALIDAINNAFENKISIKSTFIDLSRAFDVVSHDILLKKCEYYGLRGDAANILNSYLNDRPQRVFLRDNMSEEIKVTQGVPQGSILGPLLFLLYINDLPGATAAFSTILYADDTTITVTGRDSNEVQQTES